MNIFVRRPVYAIVLCVVMMLIGLWAAKNIPLSQFPEINSSAIVVSTSAPGASAVQVKAFITEPIERVVASVPGIDFVSSETVAGASNVTVWLKLGADHIGALAQLNSALNQVAYELPNNSEDPVVEVLNVGRPAALMYLDARAPNLPRGQLTQLLQQQVLPRLNAIDGVQRVALEGARAPAMRIWLDAEKLVAMNVGAPDILSALENHNIVASLGKIENEGQQVHLLSNSLLQTEDDFKQLVLKRQANSAIRLGDIARVELGEQEGWQDARYNKELAIFVSVWPQPGANEIDIGNQVYKQLEVLNQALPAGVSLDIGHDGTAYMRDALREIFVTLIETVILVSFVVLVLMGSWRSALVPLVVIPISILGALSIIWFLGFSLNLLTVLAVVLSVGLVVDDAIVVVENVARQVSNGMTPIAAAAISSRELLRPIIAMTLVIAAVYLPIGFVSGLTGQLFQEFAFTLAIAVIMSGVVSLTLSPIMSAYLVQKNSANLQTERNPWQRRANRVFDRLNRKYSKMLQHSFPLRYQVLFLSLLVSGLALPFYLFSKRELAPAEDQNSIEIIVETAPNLSLASVHKHMDQLVEALDDTPGFKKMWQVIRADGGFGGLELTEYSERKYSVHELMPGLYDTLSQLTGVRAFPALPLALPSSGYFDVELVVQSSEGIGKMLPYAKQLVGAANNSGQFMYAFSDLEINLPQTKVVFNYERMAELGLSINDVDKQLALFLAPQTINRLQGAAMFDTGGGVGRRFNSRDLGAGDMDGQVMRIIPMLENFHRSQLNNLLDLPIFIGAVSRDSGSPASNPAEAGAAQPPSVVPLGAIATMETVVGPRVINRFNQQNSFSIKGGVLPHASGESALSALEYAAEKILPSGYQIDYAGVSRQVRQEINSLLGVMFAAVVIVYLALALQFNSLRMPLVVVLGSVPLAVSAALVFTFLGWTTLNIYAQIGFITLVGLIAKNAILMTEFAYELQQQGLSKQRAIVQAAQIRLRPILMTTLATVLGHFPLLLVAGAGAEARNSIGVILVAGMALGTLFTLFVLPHVYLLLAKETVIQQVLPPNDDDETMPSTLSLQIKKVDYV